MHKIAIIKGDGTGPEVINEALKVTQAAAKHTGCDLSFTEFDYDGTRYLKTGETLSNDELNDLKQYDAILLGAIGHPDITPGILERDILLKLRFGLDQYINLRPVKLYDNVQTPLASVTPNQIDYIVVRENTGGLYTGIGGSSMTGTPNEVASQSMVYTHHQVARCIRFACETVLNRHKETPWQGLSPEEINKGYVGKLTLCGKTNVLTHVFGLWQRVMDECALEFPTVKMDYVHVDAVCIYMLESPQQFDVIVTSNMFGDIITDLAAVTQGGMGVAASGNINPNGVSMFEPIGGTAPQFTGQNAINPIAAISAAQMMLNHLGEAMTAALIERAKIKVLREMKSMRAAEMGLSTSDIGDRISEYITNKTLA